MTEGILMGDSFIGSKFGNLIVTGWDGSTRRGGKRLYNLFCSVCAKDPELFGEGIFFSTKKHLKQGNLPCGCSPNTRWTDAQYKTKIDRICKDKGFLRGSTGTFDGNLTKFSVTCSSGHSWTTNYANFLSGRGCVQCHHDNLVKPDKEFINLFRSAGNFSNETTFTRLKERDDSGQSYWHITCPKCSKDEYVDSKLCSGIFKSTYESLYHGSPPCRCSKNFRWTQEQREYQIEKVIKEDVNLLDYEWVDCYRDCYSEIVVNCSLHGRFVKSINSFINSKAKCPMCAVSGFKKHLPAFLYLLKIDSIQNTVTGFGITGDISARLADHRRNLNREGYMLEDIFKISCTGSIASQIENDIKRNFKSFGIRVTGFKKEATQAPFETVRNFITSHPLLN